MKTLILFISCIVFSNITLANGAGTGIGNNLFQFDGSDVSIQFPGALTDKLLNNTNKDIAKTVIQDIKSNTHDKATYFEAEYVLKELESQKFKTIDIWINKKSLNIELYKDNSGPSTGGGL